MNKFFYINVTLLVIAFFFQNNESKYSAGQKYWKYPKVRRDENQIDDYFGTKVADPYRWLENPDSPETVAFVDAQNNLTIPYLQKAKGRKMIENKLKDLYDHESFGIPDKRKSLYFFSNKNGLQNQAVLYAQEGLNGTPAVLLDPNTFSDDGTVSISCGEASPNGEIYAYGLSSKGSDWTIVYFRNVSSGKDFPETLRHTKWPGIEFTEDNLGIFYSRYPDSNGTADGSETTSNANLKIYYHYIGTPQCEDKVVVEFPEFPARIMGVQISDDNEYMLVSVQDVYTATTLNNLIYYAKLAPLIESKFQERPNLTALIGSFNGQYTYIASENSTMYFQTNRGAPNYRIVRIDLTRPEEKYWETLIPEHPTDVLSEVNAVGTDYLLTEYTHNVKSVFQLRRMSDGSLVQDFNLEVGTVKSVSADRDDSQFFFSFESILTPQKIYLVDLESESEEQAIQAHLFREVKLKGFDPSKYITTQVFYESKDGTKIPMFITHQRSLKLDGSVPTLLYGYGGFNIVIPPTFSLSQIAFLELFGGVYAIANIRGGGEYGEKWNDAGRLLHKQNTFDDFEAAAEYLVKQNYTTHSKLTIHGASNGGLLVGACINQRPELFGAAIAQVGVMDMLRYQLFTVGREWTSEYGTSENKINFENLIKYSPLHNVRRPTNPNVTYPSVLALTGDHDDRVVPLHSYKFISELQHKLRDFQKNPLLILVDKNAGHGIGKPTSKKIEELVNMFSFLVQTLNINITSQSN